MKKLLNEKGTTCISIILPLFNSSIDQEVDKIHLTKALSEVHEELIANYPEKVQELTQSINNLHQEIKFNRNDQGLGIYVSENIRFYCTFPFAVSEKTIIGESFHLKELLLKEQYSIPYHVLYIDEKEIKLYKGKLKELEELKNEEFPMSYKEEYEYQPSSRSTSFAGSAHVKSFEKDKYTIEKIRHEHFLYRADELLHTYLQKSEVLLLCGIRRYTSAFLNRSLHADKIISISNGNYNWCNGLDFNSIVWPSIEAYINERMLDEINEFNEKIGEGLAEEGIVRIWEAVAEGRGATLLIEKNFQAKCFLEKQNPYQLHLRPPKNPYIILEDVVNELVQLMLNKNGKIIFVHDGMLTKHHHAALITRFS